MDIDKMLAQCKAAYVDELVRRNGEEFRSSAIQSIDCGSLAWDLVWWAWLASRSSIEIELPASFDIGYGGEIIEGVDSLIDRKITIEAIESIGLKVKP